MNKYTWKELPTGRTACCEALLYLLVHKRPSVVFKPCDACKNVFQTYNDIK